MEYVLIDKSKVSVLFSETRITILKKLNKRPYTVSELSEALTYAKSSLAIHLEKLETAGLIIEKDEGRKWKYYHLTNAGKEMVEGKNSLKPIAFLLAVLVGFFVTYRILVGVIESSIQYASLHPEQQFDHELSSAAFQLLELIGLSVIAVILGVACIIGVLWVLTNRKILK